jgi:hypothetical protein
MIIYIDNYDVLFAKLNKEIFVEIVIFNWTENKANITIWLHHPLELRRSYQSQIKLLHFLTTKFFAREEG